MSISTSPHISRASSWRGAHITSITQFDAAALEYLYSCADTMRKIVDKHGGCSLLRHRVLANVFYEPSTRTSSSFAAAMQRLGGTVLSVNEVRSDPFHAYNVILTCGEIGGGVGKDFHRYFVREA